ncbi:dimethylargininase [Strigomonas culicis]|uniref:Dimethylargininase n=1 Tax=Strigomonas culicis TaxID=28005 RepID=S9WC45_9TRYP|nr:dimethylargininase [Strigomonas culicis]EPY36656.1 dimethylargininase [Strigomonas culicis]|eukprot:EPY33021.1 dimethylargininase [Strigomonas culicis]
MEFIELPALPNLPDCLFVEDVGMVYNHCVIATRPGAPSRRPEVPPMLPHLQRLAAEKKAADAQCHPAYNALENFLQIAEPGTIDGGDVLHVRNSKYVFVGQSTRTNADALAQVTRFLKDFDLEVVAVPTKNCLHVKCAATFLSEQVVLLDPKLIDAALFTSRGFDVVETSAEEAGGSNVVQFVVEERANPAQKLSVIISSTACPKTGAKIDAFVAEQNQKSSANVYRHIVLDLSEAAKAEGDVTCQSLLSYCTSE